ncbi:MAG: hypothetical protein H5T24_12735 [Bacteroidales bacterium]|nr:hypothetical protein [Bacteroidales bacterium]
MRRVTCLIVGLLTGLVLHAQTWKQNRIEVYLGLPVNHYFGDIGNSANTNVITSIKDVRIRALRGGFGGGVGFKVNPFISAQASLNTGFLGNTDDGSYYSSRDYRFSTFYSELTLKGIYYIIPESNQNYYYRIMDFRGGLRHINKPYSLYVFVGAGGLFFSATPNDKLLSRTPPPGFTKPEVDDSKYFTLVIPAGIGAKYEFYPRFQLGVELGARYVTTDYLDAFSSVYSSHNDMYYTINFNVYYKIPYQKLLKRSFWQF